MKHFYLLLLCVFSAFTNFAQTQHSNQAGLLGACTVITNSINVTCNGLCDASITAIANGVPPFSYLWSTGETTASISNLCAGTYPVVMIDSTGCIDTAIVTITEPPALSLSFITSYLNCQCTFIPVVTGGSFPYTYLWCNNSTNPIFTDCTPGACALLITDANGCMLQDTLLITPPPPITLTPSVSDATCNGCTDGTVSANLTGGIPPYTYLLLPTGATNSTGNFSGLAAGNYTLCATDSSLCTACTTLTINEPPAACSVSIISVNNILCYGDCNGSLTAVANGVPPFSYTWCNGDNSATADSLCAGNCTVIMTDSIGCIDTAVATITEPPPLVSSHTSDFSNCNCTYTLIANGGTPPYTYQWCDGSIGQSMTNCTPGSCNIAVIDANGCLITDTVIINPPPLLTLTVQTTGTTCSGCSDGSITSSTSGGLPPYTYLLTPGNLTCENCFNLTAGVYTLCVTDSYNCTTCVTDSVPDDPTAVALTEDADGFRIFPNPVKNYLHIDLSRKGILSVSNFIIRDVTGRILLDVQLNQEHSKLYLQDFSPGIYSYQLITDDIIEYKGRLLVMD